MKTIKYFQIVIPFAGEVEERMEEYQILAKNKYGRLVINNSCYTTLQEKKEKYASYPVINEISAYKSRLGIRSDGWHASCYFQCSEKIMRRKVLNKLKKEMSKEMFLDSAALEKLSKLLAKN